MGSGNSEQDSTKKSLRVLIVGADGMVGSGLWAYFYAKTTHELIGSTRSRRLWHCFPKGAHLRESGSLTDDGNVARLISGVKPDMVINCVGLTKHVKAGNDAVEAIRANSLLPHVLSAECRTNGARLLQISTDCAFSGRKGLYHEDDLADSRDVYGLSKVMGEVVGFGHALTVRTSPIWFELDGQRGLLEWFVNQKGRCSGYTRAIFSGMTASALAGAIDQHILPRPDLTGLYHVAAKPIAKFDLLEMVKRRFGLDIDINRDESVVIDRSLDGGRFAAATGFIAPGWAEMVSGLPDVGRRRLEALTRSALA